MKKKNKVYTDEYIKNLSLKREINTLAPLLWNIKQEEAKIIPIVKSTMEDIDIAYKNSFVLFTTSQVYKSYSIFGLMKYFDRNTKYEVIDLAFLLDIWYNNSEILDKNKILSCDILIIHGSSSINQASNKANALIELSEIRKTMRKITWLFIEGTTAQEFNTYYPGVTKSIGKTYYYEF